MSGEAAVYDLSGQWSGFYNMPVSVPPTSFEATLRDTGGLISGLTTEEGDTPDCYGMVLQAVIEGRREGTSVRFTKMYDYLERADYPVLYQGVIQSGGDEIAGTWEIPNVWSGTFLMVRAPEAGVAEERRIGEEIETD